MIKKLMTVAAVCVLSIGTAKAEYTYSSTLLDFGDTLGGVVQGSDGAWQNSPHGVVVAPDGHVWVNVYGGHGRMEILASGDTVHYKGIYVLDPATGQHADFSPIEILTFPDGTSDSLTAESASSGGGRGIEIDYDGNILSSHYKTLYKINYMTGEGMAMWVGESSLTEAVSDANGNIYVSYVLAGERPCVVLDADLNYVGNAIDTVGHINRALEVTESGEDLFIGSTWNGHGVTVWESSVPGVIQHTFLDTFGVFNDLDACWNEIGSAMGADSAYTLWCDYYSDADTNFAQTALWASSLDFAPAVDGHTDYLLVGALTAGWGGPLGGVYWMFDTNTDFPFQPVDFIGNWHDWEETGEGVTDGPRGAAWDADGNVYLADFYSNGIYHYAYSEGGGIEIEEPYTYSSTLIDFGDTLGGVVQGSDGAWQNSPHGVVVAPDGHVWVNIYGGHGRMEILASGDTVHYKGIYVLDPATGEHADFSPIEILTFPDGTSDSLTAESATSGGGRGIEIDHDGNILSSHYKTLYKINYMTGEGMAMWVGESSLTEAVSDANGNTYVSYVLAGERPCVVLDADLNYVGNAIDTVGHINRALEVTDNGEDMLIGSTWNGHGVTHWNSTVPGVIQHTFVDTFGTDMYVDACWDEIGSAMGADSAYVAWCDEDTVFEQTALWASSLDLSPDGDLLVGALTAGWGGPYGGVYWMFDLEAYHDGPFAMAGNWHNWDGTGEGVTDGPRGAAWDADGNLYLADFYSNGVYHYAADYTSVSDDDPKNVIASGYVLEQNYPNPFNPDTRIEFTIPVNEHVNLAVYNLEGRLVKTLVNQIMSSGQHIANWDGTNETGTKVSTGMYIYQLRTNSTLLNRRMTFVK